MPPSNIASPSSVASVLQDPFESQCQRRHESSSTSRIDASSESKLPAQNERHEHSTIMIQDPPSTKSTYRSKANASAILSSLSKDRSSDTASAASARSRLDAILTQSRQAQAQAQAPTQSRRQQQPIVAGGLFPDRTSANQNEKDISTDYMLGRTASLVDNDEDDANPDADCDDAVLLNNDNMDGDTRNSIPTYPSPPRTPTGSRVNNYGLVSILRGCAECGADDDYLCGDDDDGEFNDIVVAPAGGTPTRRRRRRPFFQRRYTNTTDPSASPGDRSLTSRVSFSEELVVRELPQMSSEEKSRRFYTADELQSIRRGAREEKETTAQIEDDCHFFCGDFYTHVCAAYAEGACVGEDIMECGSDRYGGLY